MVVTSAADKMRACSGAEVLELMGGVLTTSDDADSALYVPRNGGAASSMAF